MTAPSPTASAATETGAGQAHDVQTQDPHREGGVDEGAFRLGVLGGTLRQCSEAGGDSLEVAPVAPETPPVVEEGLTGRAARPADASLTFTVAGLPAPQGSKRGYVVNGRAVMVESSKRVKPWREAVKQAALDARDDWRVGWFNDHWQPLRGALMLTVVYTLPRPKSHYRTGRNAHLLRDSAPKWPTGKPDGDKLDRATLDALTDAGCWVDDAQVAVRLSVKSYPDVHPKARTTPGAYIRISRLPDRIGEDG